MEYSEKQLEQSLQGKSGMNTKKFTSKLMKTRDLSETLKREMFDLFEKYYDFVDYTKFLQHLQEKTHVFLFIEKPTKKFIGFSTIYRRSIPEIADGTFLFSGDTVIHEAYWGNKMLQKSFFWFILASKLRSPLKPVYWMLMSKGLKTYLMMRKNFRHSYPNYQRETPKLFDDILKRFYHRKFPGSFQEKTGLIHFKEKMGAIKATLPTPSEKVLKSPDAEFFFKMNPHFLDGDELACVAEIRFSDLFFHIFKFFIPVAGSK